MRVTICEDKHDLGYQAALAGVWKIRQAIETNGSAVVVLATGVSQFELLEELVKADVDWSKIEVFHLCEYVGLDADHSASFRRYLRKRFLDKVPALKAFYAIDGNATDLEGEVKRLSALLSGKTIDLMFLGIGENGHLAFNDPPANFDTDDPYIIVTLEERSRRQQVGEGWFKKLDEVPTQAITMSIRQILKSRCIICAVPDQRKARAVAMCLYDQISPLSPCTVLRRRVECSLFVDRPSSMLVFGDRR
ncbi:MAG: glucosamine-6-phosphate deaminase [Sphaerochaetaceae bacterium]|jgi:glucosamine-6-phosphate deaminase